MATFNAYQPTVQAVDANTTMQDVGIYINSHVNENAEYMNTTFQQVISKLTALETELASVRTLANTQADLLAAYKLQLDRIPADAGSGTGNKSKIPDPPTFSGSDNKLNLEEWLNHIALYCSANGIVTDHQRIVMALARIRSPASVYMKKYYDDVRLENDLGSWNQFVNELNAIYGKRDDKEGAKTELTQLWNNKELARKDFIKYAEQYRTLARIVQYADDILRDKLREVIPQELRSAMAPYEVSNSTPVKWEEYLELLLKTYKHLHPEKAKSTIFGSGNGSSSKSPDPNAMDIDSANKSKGKAPQQVNSQEAKKRFCQICAGKGYKNKSKTHNTIDCYDKPGNESKKPAQQYSTSNSSTSGQGNKGSTPAQGAKRSFKARLMDLLDEMDDEDPATPAGTFNVNTASIEEIVDPEPAEMEATVEIDDTQAGPSRPTGRKRKVNRRSNVDFPKGL